MTRRVSHFSTRTVAAGWKSSSFTFLGPALMLYDELAKRLVNLEIRNWQLSEASGLNYRFGRKYIIKIRKGRTKKADVTNPNKQPSRTFFNVFWLLLLRRLFFYIIFIFIFGLWSRLYHTRYTIVESCAATVARGSLWPCSMLLL